ncbi:MAG: ferrous iron transport protein B [Flavobacteriaceae bacterium]|nr:MAG: ferrous iron transport protein B [Flavobacteriaceae bacterium]
MRIALIGNPNTGKTTLFNAITGSNQRVGNYPGITVDFYKAVLQNPLGSIELIDLPGIYSLYPSSKDEEVVYHALIDKNSPIHPDQLLVVLDAKYLKRGLLLLRQLKTLEIPIVLAINQMENQTKGIEGKKWTELLEVPTFLVNSKTGLNVKNLENYLGQKVSTEKTSAVYPDQFALAVEETAQKLGEENLNWVWNNLAQTQNKNLSESQINILKEQRKKHGLIPKRLQVKETLLHYERIDKLLDKIPLEKNENSRFTTVLDHLSTHPFWGYLIFMFLMFLIFQSMFSLSELPMEWIDQKFGKLSSVLQEILPSGPFFKMISQALIPGIGGVLIFIPQISILFFFLFLMEESGYMSRVVFLMDRWLKPFGMSGKSVVPLISGAACAIPAILATRTIEQRKTRLITIFATPFVTCAARLPVYALLISLVIPKTKLFGIGIQGLVLFALYFLGIVMALLTGWGLKKILKAEKGSELIMQMPDFKLPSIKNLLAFVWEKIQDFVLDAGKIILSISIVLWALGSVGYSEEFKNAKQIISSQNPGIHDQELEQKVAGYSLEHSVLGNLGKTLEPVIAPLGYDWKMGIGIISSFAAREVFVGAMASIYNISNSGDQEMGLKEKLKNEINPLSGKKAYTLASGVSLMLFYAFAMQCMSTIAVVKKETGGWFWPITQLVYMNLVAYLFAFLAYQLLC